jgi:hypothetical protein
MFKRLRSYITNRRTEVAAEPAELTPGSAWPRRRFVREGLLYDTTTASCVYADNLRTYKDWQLLDLHCPIPRDIRPDALYKTAKGVHFTYSGKVMYNEDMLLTWCEAGPPERMDVPEIIGHKFIEG